MLGRAGFEILSQRLQRLRTLMKQNNIQCYIFPLGDEHGTEFIKPEKNQVEKMTNFSGSMATVLVFLQKSLVLIDSRYWISAEKELFDEYKMLKLDPSVSRTPLLDAMKANLSEGSLVGFNPYKFPYTSVKKWIKTAHNLSFKGLEEDLVDEVLESGKFSYSNITLFDEKYAGESVESKVLRLASIMSQKNADYLAVADLAQIAYLLNIRGSDAQHTPLAYAFMIVELKNSALNKPLVHLFCQMSKIPNTIQDHFKSEKFSVKIQSYESFNERFSSIVSDESKPKLLVDSHHESYGMVSKVGKNQLIKDFSPILNMVSVKNDVEIENAKIAHHEEAISFFKFMFQLENRCKESKITEKQAADLLESIKDTRPISQPDKRHVSLSFETIFGCGANAAEVHHSCSEETILDVNKMMLIDFGSQYLYGTTDTTRTFHFGIPTQEEKFHFTLVLKGFIAVALAKLVKNRPLCTLSALSRQFLHSHCIDYGHGHGHGVGNFLCCHEKPLSTESHGYYEGSIKAKEGLFFSNEPGCYIEGKYGIRIENVVYTKNCGNGFVSLEDLTKIPIQQKLIDFSMLDDREKKYLNDMNDTIQKEFGYLKDYDVEAYSYMINNTHKIN